MTLPTGYRAWLSSIEDDVRVRDLTEDEIAGLVAATRPATDMAAVVEALEAAQKIILLFKDESLFSEGVHAGLRKGTDAPDANHIWSVIASSRTSAWGDAIAFALDPFFTMWGGDNALTKIEAALQSLRDAS